MTTLYRSTSPSLPWKGRRHGDYLPLVIGLSLIVLIGWPRVGLWSRWREALPAGRAGAAGKRSSTSRRAGQRRCDGVGVAGRCACATTRRRAVAPGGAQLISFRQAG